MKAVLQILFGLGLGVGGILALLWLGLLVNGQPNWQTAVLVLLLITVTQWISFVAFLHRVALQVLIGVTLCGIVASWLVLSTHSFFWEARYPDGSSPITWRSCVMLTTLLAITEGASFLVFRWFKVGPRKLSKNGDITHNT
ncbi:MAG: hypothetical protein WA815_21980 [Terracidiphilus sp.]